MLDIGFIRDNLDLVKEGARKKGITVDLDRLVAVDAERRTLQKSYDEKRAEQKRKGEGIPRTAGNERLALQEELRMLKDGLDEVETKLKEVVREWQGLMLQVPNVPDISVPEGASDADNQEIRVWGEKPSFSFTPKSHVELMTLHDMADFERGTKVAGFRGYFLKNAGAKLAWAVERFVQDRFAAQDFTPMIVPSLVRREPFMGTGYLPQSEEDLYKTQDGEYLAGTGEVAGMGYYMDETLLAEELPKRFFAFSPCFRREIGAHGKDTKGLIRVHEFVKFEQIVLCEASHETSVALHEELTGNAEKLLQELGIAYHVVLNCGGDIGLGQVKKYDIEAWVPSEGAYRETHSSSYFHDFQTRRLNIRYRDAEGTLRFAHSLNNTALALPRFLVPLIENNQQEDGSIRIPAPLVPYFGDEVITAKTA